MIVGGINNTQGKYGPVTRNKNADYINGLRNTRRGLLVSGVEKIIPPRSFFIIAAQRKKSSRSPKLCMMAGVLIAF